MKRSVVYLFVSVFFLFTSCEYQLGENFVEVEKPPVDKEQADVSLNIHYPPDMAFEIEKSFMFGYDVFLQGRKFESCIFRLGDLVWERKEKSGQFWLDVDQITNGRYELVCEVLSRSNSGSIADRFGTELSVARKTWQVKIMARNETDRPLAYRINEEGHLELSWEVDESLRSEFDHYTIEFTRDNYTYIRRSNNFDQRTFVYTNYDGGHGIYKVYIYFKDETVRPYGLGIAVLES